MSDRSGVRGGWPVRLGDILGPTMQRIAGSRVMTEAQLRKVWAEVVGEQVANHANVRRLRGSVLEVGVTSDVWATELTYLSATLIERLNALLGPGTVTQIMVQRNRRERH